MAKLKIKNDDPLYRLVREGHIQAFNDKKAEGAEIDFRACDFRGVSLHGLDVNGLDFSDCYFRQADLRGIDFSSTILEGASIHAAKISGAYFPKELDADEIELSLLHGSRMRYRK